LLAHGPASDYNEDKSEWTDNPRNTEAASNIYGILQKGVTVPQDVIERLNRKSAEHWSAPHAQYSAPSRDLEAVLEELKNSHNWPDVTHNSIRASISSKIKHPKKDEQPAAAPAKQEDAKPEDTIRSYVDSLPDANTGRYNVALDSAIDGLKNDDQDAFNASKERLVGMVKRFNGDDASNTLTKHFSVIDKDKAPAEAK
jgi:hypothetical protein